jgi:hypothetical protein
MADRIQRIVLDPEDAPTTPASPGPASKSPPRGGKARARKVTKKLLNLSARKAAEEARKKGQAPK